MILEPVHLIWEGYMYRKQQSEQHEFEDFHLSFGGKLRSDNRWVRLAKLIPWNEIEFRYAEQFASPTGPPALPARIALGSLIIKEKLQLSDEEVVEQIRENPYLQYFLGYSAFTDTQPFDPSMFVHFRRRCTDAMLREINDLIFESRNQANDDSNDDDGDSPDSRMSNEHDASTETEEGKNEGTLRADATCAPASIRYPTDLSLLNEAREMTEHSIDVCHAPDAGTVEKPRTYRRKARKQYLAVAKKRKPGLKAVQRGIRQQLQYLRRNLETIRRAYSERMSLLRGNEYRSLLVVNELYRQQRQMYDQKSRSIADRIVSISQPHVRPIVRGKVNAPVEFGAKISVVKAKGFAYLENLSWDAYNESGDLKQHIEAYRRRFGVYPKEVLVDAIYRTRDNRRYCKDRGIRLGGPPLGRPKLNPTAQERRQVREDERARIPIEGVFGRAKTRYSLNRIRAKRRDTAESSIALVFLVMNLDTLLKQLSFTFRRMLMNIVRFLMKSCDIRLTTV